MSFGEIENRTICHLILYPDSGSLFHRLCHQSKTTLKKTLRAVNKRHGIPNIELIRAVSALLATDKSDFDAIENIRNNDWLKCCMGIRQMSSSSRLRQRFDEDASALMPLVNDSLAEVIVNLDAPSQIMSSEVGG